VLFLCFPIAPFLCPSPHAINFWYRGAIGAGIGSRVVHFVCGIVKNRLASSHLLRIFCAEHNLMPHLRKALQGRLRQASLDRNVTTRRRAFEESRSFERLLQIHSIVQAVGYKLRMHFGYARPSPVNSSSGGGASVSPFTSAQRRIHPAPIYILVARAKYNRFEPMPYRNEVLKRSLLYAVRHVFLIDRDSGLLLLDVSSGSHVLKDADMTSGMLTVIQDLVRESFPEERLPLETVGVGQFTIYLQHGSSAILAAAVTGTPAPELRERFRTAMDSIDRVVLSKLDWSANSEAANVEAARPYLEQCLLGDQ
jgi:hypothetical protein